MGSGSSSCNVDRQEAFVRANRETVKQALGGYYSDYQIDMKLRQAYYGTDTSYSNRDTYILDDHWNAVIYR